MLQIFHRTFTRPPWLILFCTVFLLAVAVSGSGLGASPRTIPAAHTNEELYRGLILAHGPVAELIPEIRDHLMPARFTGDIRLIHAIELFQDQLIEAVKNHDPQFLASFGAGIRSGDHLRIQDTLEQAGKLTVTVLRQMAHVRMVSRALRDDPGKYRALLNKLKHAPGAEDVTEAEIVQALDAVVAHSFSEGGSEDDPYVTSASIVAVIVIVIAIVAAVTVVAAAAVVLTVSVYLSVFAWSSSGSPGGPKRKKDSTDGLSLLEEQMIDSIALTFAK